MLPTGAIASNVGLQAWAAKVLAYMTVIKMKFCAKEELGDEEREFERLIRRELPEKLACLISGQGSNTYLK